MQKYRTKHWKNIRRIIYSVLCAMLIFGSILIYAVYQVTTTLSLKSINQEADLVMSFLQSSCQKYDDFQLGASVSELQTMMLQINNLKSYLDYTQLEDAGQLEKFINEQYLSGFFILDDELNVSYSIDRNNADASVLLRKIMSEANIQNVLNYPQKTFAEQVKIEGQTYDYVIAARSDRPGVIICYDNVTVSAEDKNEFSLNSLLSGDSFRKNAIIVVTDGENVLCSNTDIVNGLSVKDCPFTSIGTHDGVRCNGALDIVQLESQNGIWYGKHELYRQYYLYVFYSTDNVFASRTLILIIVAVAYVVACVLGILILQYLKKRKLLRKENEYHLINVIASIYTANFSIYPEKNIWKPIVMSERMEKVVGHIPEADKMLATFNATRVAESCREAFDVFVRLNDLKERLDGKRFIGYTFEDVEHMWYQILLIPQQRDDTYEMVDYRVMLVIRNVTEQKKAEMDYQEKLRISALEAKRANDAKTDFLKRMSHDIRTPINGIRGMVTVGKSCIGDEVKVEDCLNKIERNSDLLMDFVTNVLDMSKLESGDVVLDEKAFDIEQLLKDMDMILRAHAEEKDVVLNIKPVQVEHTHLIGSPLHIRQVIRNITANAIKFNRQNGSVTVSCRELSYDADAKVAVFEFICADTGVGMSEEFQKKAFELFSQESADTSARTTYTGTGLGLAIAKKLVDYMHGEITFKSTQGVGTEFKVILRIKIDEEYYRAQVVKNEVKSIQGMHILVVEDNELNMEIAEYLLTEQGAVVTKAWDGREALNIFTNSEIGSFDVILMDIMMPEMDGLEATRRIRALDRADAKTVSIIAMSANAFDDDIAKSRDAGMNTHLAKPLDFDKLVEAIVQLKM